MKFLIIVKYKFSDYEGFFVIFFKPMFKNAINFWRNIISLNLRRGKDVQRD